MIYVLIAILGNTISDQEEPEPRYVHILYMALRTSKKDWISFLSTIGISANHSEKYATRFTEQELSIHLVKFVSDEELRDIYLVKLAGHRVAIRHGTDQSSSTQQPGQSSVNTPTIRPQVRHQPHQLQPKMTPSSFRAFITHWTVYKSLVGFP